MSSAASDVYKRQACARTQAENAAPAPQATTPHSEFLAAVVLLLREDFPSISEGPSRNGLAGLLCQ